MVDIKIEVGVPSPDGKGTCVLSGPFKLPEEYIWKPFINKVYHPNQYLPVKDVEAKEVSGVIHRGMTVKPDGPRVVETIHINKETGEVLFDVLDSKGEPSGEKRYNILHRGANGELRIEYSLIGPDGIKKPLSDGTPVRHQIQEAFTLCTTRQLFLANTV